MVAFSERPNVEWCAASINSGPLGFVAEDNARPGHQQPLGPSRWILHASPNWSTEHIEEDPEVFAALMLEAFGQLPGVKEIDHPCICEDTDGDLLVEKTTTFRPPSRRRPSRRHRRGLVRGPQLKRLGAQGFEPPVPYEKR